MGWQSLFDELRGWGRKPAIWVLAFGLLLLAFLLFVIAVLASDTYDSVYHDYAASEAHADAKDIFDRECRPLTEIKSALDCAEKAVAAARETQRSEEDLYAQKQMAKWAYWLLISTGLLGVVSVAITGIGTYLLLGTVSLGRRANEIARESLIAQTRPWIKVEEVLLEKLWLHEGNLHAEINIKCKNVGASPAQRVRILPILSFDYFMFDEAPKGQVPQEVTGPPVFSGENYYYPVSFSRAVGPEIDRKLESDARLHTGFGWTEEIAKKKRRQMEQVGFSADVSFSINVFYCFDGSDRVHRTTTAYRIVRDCPPDWTVNGVLGGGGMWVSDITIASGKITHPGLRADIAEHLMYAD